MEQIIIIAILAVIALGAVAYPVLVGRERYADSAQLEADIERYREAVAANTVCPRCKQANPADARFCAECGESLGED